MKTKQLIIWDTATDDLAKVFVKKYFGDDVSDLYWIGTQDKEVLAVNDYFFNLNDLMGFMRYNYTRKDMFDFYDYFLEGGLTNIRSWRKLKK